MDFQVGRPGEVPPQISPGQWAPWEPRLSTREAHNIETGCWIGKEGLRRWEEEEFHFLIVFFVCFWRKPTNGSTVSGRKINVGMRSSRSGMRVPSLRRGLGRLFPGPLPLIPPIAAGMQQLNWLQRSRKVFWKLQNRRV